MSKLLKRWRFMRVGELKHTGDQYLDCDGEWKPVVGTLGTIVFVEGDYRTKRPLPKFYAKK